YATKFGDIGLTIAGKFPIKWGEQGKFVLDGSNPDHEWKGFIPYEHVLKVKNPKSGYVSSANQHPSDKTYPYYYYSHNYEMYRGRRLNERLEAIDIVELEDVKKVQNDNFSYKAYEALPLLLEKLDTINLSKKEKEIYNSIKRWDYFANPDDSNTSSFVIWWDKIRKTIWDEFDTMKYSYRKPSSFTTYKLISDRDSFDYYDILKTEKNESIEEIINMTFKSTVDSLESWKIENETTRILWKNFKNTRVNHLLGIRSFSLENINVGGDRNIINAASGRHGPSWRMIVKLNKNQKTEAWGVYPGGQSGNPGSFNYFNGIKEWGEGKYSKLLFNNKSEDNDEFVIFNKKFNK
ncbi:MAG: penicillin acylase family protein, partial [Flammeovirgaceae bacterium]